MRSSCPDRNLETMRAKLAALVHGEIAEVREEDLPVNPGSAGTGLLCRVTGTTVDGRGFAFFVKRVQSVRHWPYLHLVPEQLKEQWIADMPWRAEVEAYQSDLKLPDGLRRPRVHLVDDLGDDRIDLWLENVEHDGSPWDLAAYDRAAYLLGGMAALNPTNGDSHILRMYVNYRVNLLVAELDDPDLWRHPVIAEAADGRLRDDLLALRSRIPEFLDAMTGLPRTMAHGDAAPANFSSASSEDLVALDWAWHSPHPLGGDLAQLLAGRANDGEIPVWEIPAIHDTVITAYMRGLADHGVSPEGAQRGFYLTLLLRSGFTMIPVEKLDLPAEVIRRRVGMARFIVDAAQAL